MRRNVQGKHRLNRNVDLTEPVCLEHRSHLGSTQVGVTVRVRVRRGRKERGVSWGSGLGHSTVQQNLHASDLCVAIR